MATEQQMHELIGRSVIDHDFRNKVMTHPVDAAAELGFVLTDEQLANVQNTEGKGMATVLDERLPKSVGYIW